MPKPLPHRIDTIEHVWIELGDGTRLSARLRLPEAAPPQPAILEYLPYRKDDGTLPRDNMNHDYMAGHGYAMVRVDIRGSGDSEGVLAGEYLESELADCVEVIEWIADQPWCDGNVGMMGISWGGFNALQVAARQPPALQAIVSVASTADRYNTDVHYRGGSVLGTDMLAWASTMFCFNARPPTPRIVGEEWRDEWLERLRQTPRYVEEWLTHQRRDEFWKHGSICEDFSEIECPVLIVAGFADGYTETVFDVVAGLTSPVRGIVGPWSHNYPSVGVPGPNIGFLQECLRWWDQHLRGHDLGGMEEEPLRVWMHEWTDPASYYSERPGRWVAEPSWPSPSIVETPLWLSADGLVDAAPQPAAITGSCRQTYGLRAGLWWGYGNPGTLPDDQRLEDAAAFSFVSPVAEGVEEILGRPTVELKLSVDVPVATVSARLCDVAPDGASLLVSRGFLNLTHRDSHDEPSPMVPGEPTRVALTMDAAAHSLPAGHRWELHVGTGLWPLAWPAPAPTELTLHLGEGCYLTMPRRPVRPADEALRPFDDPLTAAPRTTVIEPATSAASIEADPSTGCVTMTHASDSGREIVDQYGTEVAAAETDIWEIDPHDPLSARTRSIRTWSVRWGDVEVTIETDSEMWADATHWHATNQIVAIEGGRPIHDATHTFSIERDLN